MGKKDSVLLVEGQADIDFFEALLRRSDMLDRIEIRPPRNFGFRTNTVSHFPKLIKLLLKMLKAGQVRHFGIVADADHVSGGGFEQRWKQMTQPLKDYGYRIPSNPPKLPCLGSIFRHSELPPVGLWLMPDRKHNGMLEDLIYKTVKREENQGELIKWAEKCVSKLPVRLFSSYHHTKAIVYSWLAWQKRPGQTLDVAINGELIDSESKEMQGFVKWLHSVFG